VPFEDVRKPGFFGHFEPSRLSVPRYGERLLSKNYHRFIILQLPEHLSYKHLVVFLAHVFTSRSIGSSFPIPTYNLTLHL
jgi:hypothetical protein